MSEEPNLLHDDPEQIDAPEISDSRSAVRGPSADDETLRPPDDSDLVVDAITRPALPYLIAAIGASAGGVEAYIQLLKGLPADTGVSLVFISHLAPDQKSHLVEILARSTRMPVALIEHESVPKPNHVYVLPPNMLATMSGGKLLLETRVDRYAPLAIDHFFRSLAADQKNHAVGVVLSGMDSDGALGLRAIKGEGGIAMVQAPESARYPAMPRNSLAADHPDFALEPAQIGVELARLAWQFAHPSIQMLDQADPKPDEKQTLARILRLLTNFAGLDYRHYKPGTIQRRISRRMLVCKITDLEEYLAYLQIHPEELRLLHEDTLIGVTRFFRDFEVFSAVSSEVLPRILESRESGQQIRIWVAGCASGEEVYSLAMCLVEALDPGQPEPPIQIFGTDASEASIQKARAGLYPDTITSDVSGDRLRRFFVKTEKGYQISKRIRDLCIFARQNLCVDPPLSNLDLVSCRNVLIYLDRDLQNRILPAFHYALRPSGFLLLGNSESIREFEGNFGPFDRRNKIFRKQGQMEAGFHLNPLLPHSQAHNRSPRGVATRKQVGWSRSDFRAIADRATLARHSPPGVIINEQLEILEFRGKTTPFLEMGPGAPSASLMKVARENLAGQLFAAVRKAIDTDLVITTTASVADGPTSSHVTIEVSPLAQADSNIRYYLILFSSDATSPTPDVTSRGTAEESDHLLTQVKSDLAANQLYSQSLLEERDASNQDLTAANEEIQSSNEELQSTNEELETTKEELQSANEELQTVNEELQQRNNVLTETSNDLTNLLNSVNIPVLMLNNELEIRQFTPLVERLMSIRATDVGRPLTDIRLGLSVENLEPVVRDVLDTLGTRELEVKDREGRWRLLRIRPYRTVDNKIEGVVLTLVDVDELRRVQQNLREARDFSQAVVESSQVPLAILNADSTIQGVNAAFRSFAALPERDLTGRSFPDLARLLWQMDIREYLNQLRSEQAGMAGIEFRHESALGGEARVFRVWGRAIQADGQRPLLITVDDISQQAQAERALANANQRLEEQIESRNTELNRTQSELRRLAATLFTSQEEERRRVARELHDDITQRLAVLQIDLDSYLQGPPKHWEEIAQKLDKLRSKTAQLSDDVRGISHRLHPSILDDLGLAAALKALVEDLGARENMPASFFQSNLPDAIPLQVAGALYRVTQEALRNIVKHAGRTHVKVSLEGTEGLLHLQVADSGKGFEPNNDQLGLGLLSMAERVRMVQGSFAVHSAPRMGTTIRVDVPLDSQ